jgi:hypothetical protein
MPPSTVSYWEACICWNRIWALLPFCVPGGPVFICGSGSRLPLLTFLMVFRGLCLAFTFSHSYIEVRSMTSPCHHKPSLSNAGVPYTYSFYWLIHKFYTKTDRPFYRPLLCHETSNLNTLRTLCAWEWVCCLEVLDCHFLTESVPHFNCRC